MTRLQDVIKWKSQYQKRQWEVVPYDDREFTAALYQKDGEIATITLNRPDKRNALNDKMFEDLLAGLHKANDDPEVKAVIFKGAGGNFSSGHDLSSPLGEESPPVHPDLAPNVRDFYNIERRRCSKYEDILRFPKPTVAQVEGSCIGAGGEIQAACDFTVAADNARFGVRGFGVAPLGLFESVVSSWPSGSQRLRAGHLLPELSGKDMEAIGAINKAVPLAQLDAEAHRWARAAAAIPAQSFTLAKEAINGSIDVTGYGTAWRSHYDTHVAIQWVRFRRDEVSFYRAKKAGGLKGYLEERRTHATPKNET